MAEYHRDERGLENQLGALGLVLNCVVLWTTVYLDAAVRHLKAQGYPVRDEDMARLSPFVSTHLGVNLDKLQTCYVAGPASFTSDPTYLTAAGGTSSG
jgi:hypothetical protein